MALTDLLERAKAPRKTNNAEIINIGITRDDATKLIKGEIPSLVIARGNSIHTITKLDDEHLMARVEFSAPFDCVVAPAYNGNNNARIFFMKPCNGSTFNGSALVLTEAESRELFATGATAHDKDGHWIIEKAGDSVRINGGLSEGQRFQYNCVSLTPDFDALVVRG